MISGISLLWLFRVSLVLIGLVLLGIVALLCLIDNDVVETYSGR